MNKKVGVYIERLKERNSSLQERLNISISNVTSGCGTTDKKDQIEEGKKNVYPMNDSELEAQGDIGQDGYPVTVTSKEANLIQFEGSQKKY